MPPVNPVAYMMDPKMRLALFEALGIPPTDLNLQGTGGYSTTQDRYPLETPPQGPPTATPDLVSEGLAAFQAPEQAVTPVEPQKLSTLQFIAGALADALGGYTAGKMGRPVGPSIIQQLQRRREEEAQRKTEELRGEQARKRAERLAEAQAKIEVGLQENRRADAARVRAEAGLERLNARQMAEEERRISEQSKATEKLRERQTILQALKDRGLSVTPEFEMAYLATGDFPPREGKGGEEGSYAGFKTMQQLASAVEQAANAEMRASMTPEIVEIPNPGNPFEPVKRQIVQRPSITRAEARKRAMALYPGSEQFLPTAEEPTEPTGLTLEDVQRKLRERQPQR